MDYTWSKIEKKIAKKAFDLAYEKKCTQIIDQIKTQELSAAEDVWKLGTFIKNQQKEVDRMFDYRYSQLVLVFPILIKNNLLSIEDLAGLNHTFPTLLHNICEFIFTLANHPFTKI